MKVQHGADQFGMEYHICLVLVWSLVCTCYCVSRESEHWQPALSPAVWPSSKPLHICSK